MSAADLTTRFFLAVVVILIVCKLVSLLVGRAGQPPVVGEMIAGVLLGPSLLGEIAPRLETDLFPKALLPIIYVAGQLGLVALMFQAGRELRSYLKPGLGRTAVTISSLGVVVPLAAGIGLALAADGRVAIFMPGVHAGVTAAFVGVTLAITAFPMLARIIIERGLSGTRFGSLALACGGIDDMAAWILLAGVLSLAAAKLWPFTKALGGAITMVVTLAAAWFTTDIGLYAVFGAFSIGLVMPPEPREQDLASADPAPGGPAQRDLVTPTMDGFSRMLVPMFFTYSGLNTRFALLTNPRVLLFSVAAIVVAVFSKGGACWLGALLAGEPGSVAARIGTLMNARGLMQLIALNIGLQAGIASQDLFTSLVLVALVTTIMTAPVLSWIERREVKTVAVTRMSPELGEATG
jgi:Kef-type K+ transport system membrane component KefB